MAHMCLQHWDMLSSDTAVNIVPALCDGIGALALFHLHALGRSLSQLQRFTTLLWTISIRSVILVWISCAGLWRCLPGLLNGYGLQLRWMKYGRRLRLPAM